MPREERLKMNAYRSPPRSSVESILKQGLDQVAVESPAVQEELCLDHHENVRGEEYYH